MQDLCCLYHRIISCIQTFLIYSQEDIYLILRFRYILSVSPMSTVLIVSIMMIDLESPRLGYNLNRTPGFVEPSPFRYSP